MRYYGGLVEHYANYVFFFLHLVRFRFGVSCLFIFLVNGPFACRQLGFLFIFVFKASQCLSGEHCVIVQSWKFRSSSLRKKKKKKERKTIATNVHKHNRIIQMRNAHTLNTHRR